MKRKVFLVNDSRAQNNWGCRATTTALINLIDLAGGTVIGTVGHAPHTKFDRPSVMKNLIRAALTPLPSGVQLAYRFQRQLQKIQGPSQGFVSSLDSFEKMADFVDQGKIWRVERDGIRSADTIIVNGEGSVYGQELKGFLALFWAWYAKFRCGKLVAFVNHTADLSDPEMRRAAEAVYPTLDDVSFREPVSWREAGYAAPQAKPGVVPDAAYSHVPLPFETVRLWAAQPGFFSVWPCEADGFDISKPYVAVTGSSAINRPDSADRVSPVRQFKRLCQALEKLELPVLLVAPDPTDAEFLYPISRSLKLPLIAPSTPLPIAHQVLANAACLIGGRWHPGILAATGGTPLVALTANTNKTAGLLEQLGLDDSTFNALDLVSSIDLVIDRVGDYLAQGNTLRDRIRARADVLRMEARGNVRILETAGVAEELPASPYT